MNATSIQRLLATAQPITDREMALGATRLLPPPDVIPDAFWRGNLYTALAESLCQGADLPPLVITLKPGCDPEQLRRIALSHLRSAVPSHAHKIAGVGYLISQMATLTTAPVDAAAVRIETPT